MKLSKEIKAAIFVLTSILLFIFGFNYLKGTSLLDRQKTLYAVYDEVDGLLVGANVMINGLSIGNVTELDFLPNSTKILVTIKVKDKLNFSSSAPWKINFTVPSKSLFFDNISAAPIRMAIWLSCPQACIIPSFIDIKGR